MADLGLLTSEYSTSVTIARYKTETYTAYFENAGTASFYCSNSSLALVMGYDDAHMAQGSGAISCEVEANTTVTFYVSNYTYDTQTVDITITPPSGGGGSGDSGDGGSSDGDRTHWYNLTGTKSDTFGISGEEQKIAISFANSGTATFYSSGSGDAYGFLYLNGDVVTSDDDSGEGQNFRFTYDVVAGVEYEFGFRFFSGGAGSITVYVEAPAGAGGGSNDDAYWNSVSGTKQQSFYISSNNIQVIWIIFSYTGTADFRFISETVTNTWLCDSNGTLIAGAQTSYSSGDYAADYTYPVVKGTTYKLVVRHDSTSASGYTNVIVTGPTSDSGGGGDTPGGGTYYANYRYDFGGREIINSGYFVDGYRTSDVYNASFTITLPSYKPTANFDTFRYWVVNNEAKEPGDSFTIYADGADTSENTTVIYAVWAGDEPITGTIYAEHPTASKYVVTAEYLSANPTKSYYIMIADISTSGAVNYFTATRIPDGNTSYSVEKSTSSAYSSNERPVYLIATSSTLSASTHYSLSDFESDVISRTVVKYSGDGGLKWSIYVDGAWRDTTTTIYSGGWT